MNAHCISIQTEFSMAFATGLRLLRSYQRPLSFLTGPTRFHATNRAWFVRADRPRCFAVKASTSRRREEEEEGNGGVMAVKGSDGNGGGGDGRIVISELHKEATEAYMAYAMSVLLGRALPDVRDGLKPVHRRILYAMHELGLASRKPYKKCARVVGEVLGKFHPHGDNAMYDSLV